MNPYNRHSPRSLPSPVGLPQCHRPAFTMLEMMTSLAVLSIGVLGLGTLMVRQSKQISQAEKWCVPDPTYYVVGQSDGWMLALDAPASLANSASVMPWTSPVNGKAKYTLTLLSLSRAYASANMSATVSLQPADGNDADPGGGDPNAASLAGDPNSSMASGDSNTSAASADSNTSAVTVTANDAATDTSNNATGNGHGNGNGNGNGHAYGKNKVKGNGK